MSTETQQTSLRIANNLVGKLHRHHQPVVGHKFSIGLYDGLDLRGAAIISRPVARHLDDGSTLEITRCATDGVKNGCSKLYAAARKLALSNGYTQIITYTSIFEPGSSLEASGFVRDWQGKADFGISPGGSWSRCARPRERSSNTGPKVRWIGITDRVWPDEWKANFIWKKNVYGRSRDSQGNVTHLTFDEWMANQKTQESKQ